MAPAQVQIHIGRAGLGVARHAVGTGVEEVVAIGIGAGQHRSRALPVLAKMPAERLKTLSRMEHGVHAQAVAAVEAGVGPLVVGSVLVLREPADAAGVGLVMGPGVAAEAGEVLVEAAAVGDVHAAALEEARGLHLADAAKGRIGPHGVAGLRRGRVDVDGAELVDAARGVDADDAGGALAQLPLDGEAVLNLVGDFGVGCKLEPGRAAAR